ncbi:uncharacterized protein LOC119899094 [Micropterus salmoides]|uniref:uncharacterized protein LOC119899094 n=1 Tax=Micropterus salmoides TaxID=27706 RepID=UPI0018EC4D99|nr:uncharacterized protein LOC119899094 [Micropterus salmoides]
MPSVEQKFECHHAVWLEEAFHEQTQAKRESLKQRPHVYEHKWTNPESQLKMTHAPDSFAKNMKRKSMSEDWSKSPLVSVSTATSETDLSESSKQKNNNLGGSQVFPTETSSLALDSNTLSTEKLELAIPSTFDLSKTQSEITLTNKRSSPQEKDEKLSLPKQSEHCDLAKQSSMTPEPHCQTAKDSPDDQISTPTPSGSGSPQLDQLLSDLEEMKLKFRPETLYLPLSESSDESPEDDQIHQFEDLSPEDQCPLEYSDSLRVSTSSGIQLAEDMNYTNVALTEPSHCQTSIQDEPEVVSVTTDLTQTSETSVPPSLGCCNDSPGSPTESLSIPEFHQRCCEVMESTLNSKFPLDIFQTSKYDENAAETFSSVSFPKVVAKSQSDIPEEHLANIREEDSTTDILQNQEKLRSSNDSRGVTVEISTQSSQNQFPDLWEATSVTQSEDLFSQSLSDLTPETVRSARHFCFEELMAFPSPWNLETSSDEDRPRTSGQHSEQSLTPVDSECFASQPTSVKPKAEVTSSTSDEEYSIPPGYADISSTATIYIHMPPEYADVVNSGADSPTFEYSDPEAYFDCKQAASDFSETEPDEPESSTRLSGDQPHDQLSYPRVLERLNQKVLLSSGSEDYEDAPFVKPLHNVREENEELSQYSDASEEFTLCGASQPPPVCETGAYDDTDKYLARVR